MADELLTLLAGVSVAALVAGDAVRTVFHLDVFASAEGLLALFAAKPVAHDVRAEPGGERGGGGRRARAGGEDKNRHRSQQLTERECPRVGVCPAAGLDQNRPSIRLQLHFLPRNNGCPSFLPNSVPAVRFLQTHLWEASQGGGGLIGGRTCPHIQEEPVCS